VTTFLPFASAIPNACPAHGMLAPHAPIDYPPEMARGSVAQTALMRVSVTRTGESLSYELHACRHCGLAYVTVAHADTDPP
jgi:hypothetical protein